MKRRYFALAALILLAFIIIGCTNSDVSNKKNGGILGVADFQSNPSSIKGTVVVTGVVARVSGKDKQLFALIDTDEAKHCKSTGCAKFYLPVSFEGAMPEEWDEVNITGQIIDQGGLLFRASKLDIVRHLTIQ
jgi:hypothetical protein